MPFKIANILTTLIYATPCSWIFVKYRPRRKSRNYCYCRIIYRFARPRPTFCFPAWLGLFNPGINAGGFARGTWAFVRNLLWKKCWWDWIWVCPILPAGSAFNGRVTWQPVNVRKKKYSRRLTDGSHWWVLAKNVNKLPIKYFNGFEKYTFLTVRNKTVKLRKCHINFVWIVKQLLFLKCNS